MRLKDTDAIMAALNIFNDKENGNAHFLNGIETAKEIIADAPTIEAEDVRRGMCIDCIIHDEPTIEAEPVRRETEWIPVSKKMPSTTEAVNVTWVNRNPPRYYERIKGVPQIGTAHYCSGSWWWESPCCQDYLDEYGYSTGDGVDEDIDITAWMPLPKPWTGVEE